MQWEFLPEEVVKGEAVYSLADFRADLAREVEMNMPDADAAQRDATHALLYDACYWLATGHEFEAFLASYSFDPPTCEFLRAVQPTLEPNVEMLGAILQRMIMNRVEAGAQLEQALEQVAVQHRRIVEGVLPDPRAPLA